MQFQNLRVSSDITNVTAKIDQLLRLYQMCKKSDLSKKALIEKKINDLIALIKNDPIYAKIQTILAKYIQVNMEDSKAPTKIQRQISNVSSSKQPSSINPSTEKQKKQISEASVSNNNISSGQNSKNKSKGSQSGKFGENSIKQISIDKKFQTPSNQSSQSDISNQKSEDNGFELLMDNTRAICSKYQDKIEDIISINEDIFAYIKQTEDKNIAYLFGINNAQKNYQKKLFVCTLMKFGMGEVLNSSIDGEIKYGKQYKMFQNNLRTPLGLIMIGKNIEDVCIEHVRFLADMNSPYPIIILLESYNQKNGIMYQFRPQTARMARDLNKVEFKQKSEQLKKQYGSKGIDLIKVQVAKEKVVITKNLVRSINTSVESAQNAIQIQSSNECIKQEPNRFPYKLHTKYFVSPKSDYQLFFLDNQIVSFKMSYKQKQFDLFKKFVLEEAHNKGSFLLSSSVLKQTSQIKKDFFKLLCQCKTRDQYFLVNLSGITVKKTVILSLRQTVTEEDINSSQKIQFKDLQKSSEMINVVAIITKANYKTFETQNKVQVIDLTTKKK